MVETTTAIARGRPRKFAEYEQLHSSLKKGMKRPAYVKNIGILRGITRDTVYAKICLKHGGVYDGKTYKLGQWIEINLGRLASFNWQQLEDRRDELQGKADRNEPLEETPMLTFSDYADKWLERAKTRIEGYKTAQCHVEKYLKPEFGGKALDHVSTSDVNSWIAAKLDGYKPAYVKRIFNTLRAILNDAIKAELLTANPCKNADKINGIVGRERFLNADEWVTLYMKAQRVDEHFADFLLWGINSGMRKSEILALLWTDIRELPGGKTFGIIRKSKSGKPRFVTCTATMKEILDRQRERKQDERVFPIAQMTLRRRWDKTREESEIGDVTIHDLRRTHSTHVAASGVDLRTLAGRLGHSDLSMLHKHYAMLTSEADDKALNTIEELFGEKGNDRLAATNN